MKNPDLTTIISGVLGVALIIMATVVLLYIPTNIIFAGSLVVIAAGLNGYNAALKAPSPQQADQLISALAASGPVNAGPLVQIHTTPEAAQVSSAALPAQAPRQAPQPILMPGIAPQSMNSGNTFMPQGPGPMVTTDMGPFQVVQPPMPQGTATPPQQAPYQVDRNWTGLVPTVPPGQTTQQ